MRRDFVARGCAAILVAAAVCCAVPARADAVGEEAARAWLARDHAATSFKISWTERLLDAAGSVGLTDEDGKSLGPFPREDTTVTRKVSLAMDGTDKFRYEYEGLHPAPEAQTYVPTHFVAVTNGVEHKEFNGVDQASVDSGVAPHGWRYNAAPTELQSIVCVAPLIFFRPSLPAIRANYDLAKFSKVGEARVRGVDTVALESPRESGYTVVFLDPRRGYLPLRCQYFWRWRGGPWRVVVAADFEYALAPTDVWQPSKWTVAAYDVINNGALVTQLDATVSAIQMNPRFPPGEFEFGFPVGTVVLDVKDGGVAYIVQPDGRRRIISIAEADAHIRYNRLLSTETDEDLQPSVLWRWLILSANAVLLAAVVLLVWRSVKRRRRLAGGTGSGVS